MTIHDTLNFGSLLQTFGLYKAVESLGVDVEIIDYKCKAIAHRERTFRWSECETLRDYARHFLFHKILAKRYENQWKFIRNNMRISKPFDKANVKTSNDEYDTFLVGSDIVWGMRITGHDLTFMLDFADDNKKKLAFSSSVGTKWEDSYSAAIKNLLSRFDRISVREQLAAQWIGELLDKEIPVTCDPTMLWDKDFWSKYVSSKALCKDKYVLVYMRSKDRKNIRDAKEYAKKHHMKVLYINFDIPVPGVKNVKPMDIGEWLWLFKNAEVVFSGSYHGLLFSLYLHRNVFFYNWGNKARMASLAKEIGIEHREGTDENVAANQPIDYTAVDEVLSEKREYSWNLLKGYFNKL